MVKHLALGEQTPLCAFVSPVDYNMFSVLFNLLHLSTFLVNIDV